MKRILSLSLAALMLVAALAGCSGKPSGGDDDKQLTAEERTELYKTAIENARSAEDNEYNPLLTETDDDTASMSFEMLGVTADDMNSFAIAVSMMNVRAYGIAAIYPAADKSETVLKGLNAFVDMQKQNFEMYLADQYEIASNARVETLEDGTILMVMCEGQDDVFTAIKTAVEAGK